MMNRRGKSIIAAAAVGSLLAVMPAAVKSQERSATEAKPKAAAETHTPFRRTVFTGNEMLMAVFNTLASDCSAVVRPDVRVVTPPANGVVRFDAIICRGRAPARRHPRGVQRQTGDLGRDFLQIQQGICRRRSCGAGDRLQAGFVGRFSYDIEVR